MSRKEWEEGKATRSGLLWEVERILKELPKEQLPDILIMENVPQVHAEKNREDFESWLTFLRNRGYHNFWQDMNATDYGVAQNRVRCFCVSVLSDDYVEYDFPEEIPLETVVEDYLESDVDSKFFITSEKAEKLIGILIEKGVLPNQSRELCRCAVDLSIREPKKLSKANCIAARIDRGISNMKSEGTGVVLPCLMNYNRIDTVGNAVAKTFMSRDSKGFGTGFEVQNGVIECKTE